MFTDQIKSMTINTLTNECEEIIYYTEEEIAEIKARKEEIALEESLIPNREEIENAEFELKLLEKLIQWGVIL